jgi:hypothetical protein
MKDSYDFSCGKRGPAIPDPGTVLITIDLDDATFEYLKAESERTGKSYRTLINEALAESLNRAARQSTAASVRDFAGDVSSQDVEGQGKPCAQTSKDPKK